MEGSLLNLMTLQEGDELLVCGLLSLTLSVLIEILLHRVRQFHRRLFKIEALQAFNVCQFENGLMLGPSLTTSSTSSLKELWHHNFKFLFVPAEQDLKSVTTCLLNTSFFSTPAYTFC